MAIDNSMKGTTPAKGTQHAVDVAWGANKASSSPQEALANNLVTPVPVPGNGKPE